MQLIHENMFTQLLCLYVLINIRNTFLSQESFVRAENSFCSGAGGGNSLSNQYGGGVPPSDDVPYHSLVGMETHSNSLTPSSYRYRPVSPRLILHFPEDMYCHGPCPKLLTLSWVML